MVDGAYYLGITEFGTYHLWSVCLASDGAGVRNSIWALLYHCLDYKVAGFRIMIHWRWNLDRVGLSVYIFSYAM